MGRAPDWLTARPIAHRGLHDKAAGIIENSASAVRAAIDGNFAIEVDIQITADGDAVVFHDATLDRLTGETGRVADHRAAELCDMVLSGGNGDRIWRLDTLLALVAGHVPLVVELKSLGDGDASLADIFARVAGSYPGPIAAMSFNPGQIARLRAIAPSILRGFVSFDYPEALTPHLSPRERFLRRSLLAAVPSRPQFISYGCNALPSLPTRVARRLLGLPLVTWTVRTQGEADRLAGVVDAITFEGFYPRETEKSPAAN
ncbi:MAG: glycerophosphodiester phosphodiesterase family protein [Pseudomonadota bacterium]